MPGDKRTLVQSLCEPGSIQDDVAIADGCGTLKGVLDGDLAAVLLAEQGAGNGAVLLAQGVSCDVIGYGEQDEGVEDGLQPRVGRLLGRDERVLHGSRASETGCSSWGGEVAAVMSLAGAGVGQIGGHDSRCGPELPSCWLAVLRRHLRIAIG